MKLTTLVILSIIIIGITNVLTFLILEKFSILQVQIIPIDVKVINSSIIGINVDPGFYFGSIRPGSGGGRLLSVTDVEHDIMVTFEARGNVSKWMNFPNGARINKGEAINLSISISVPRDAALGYYSGEAKVILRRA